MNHRYAAGWGTPAAGLLVLVLSTAAEAQICNGRTLTNQGTIRPTTTGQTVSGSVTSTVGQYYDVQVFQAGSYTFTFCAPGSSSYDSWLCLLDPSNAQLASNDDTCGLQAQIIYSMVTPGVYKIAVSGFSSNFGTYTLSYSSSVANAPPPLAAPQVFPGTPVNGAVLTSATPTLNALVVRSTTGTTVHAEFNVDGAGFVDGSVIAGDSGNSTLVSAPLSDGPHSYVVRAHDDAPLFSATSSTINFTVDTSPPVAGTVRDGVGTDIEVQSGRTVIAANWTGFSDPQTGITSYAWAIGTTVGGTQVQAFTGVGTATRASTSPVLTLAQSVRYYVTVRATNGVGLQTTATSNGVVVMSLATATPLTPGQVGAAYSEILTASFGTGPYTFALSTGTLPPSLSLAANGALTGTPSTPGRYVLGATVTDALSATQFRDYTVVIYPAAPALFQTTGNPSADTGLEWGVIAFAYSRTFTALGGTSPLVWKLSSGALPGGVTLDSLSGTISGTVAGPPGTYTAQVSVSDSEDPTVTSTASFTIVVAGAVTALSITTPATLQTGRAGNPYVQILVASGGVRPLTWSATGTLPGGLSLAPDGVISGTPTTAETATFDLTVADAAGSAATLSPATLDVQAGGGALSIRPLSLPVAVVGNAYPITFTATGGTAPYAWSVSSGTLPPGLTLSAATGALTGSPTTRGYYRFVVTALDAGAPLRSSSVLYSACVLGATVGTNYLLVTPTPLAYAVVNEPYQGLLSILGGTGPHTWSIFSGALPVGLTLDSTTGLISGTPTGPGPSAFTVSVVSSNGLSTLESFSLPVTTGLLPMIVTAPAMLTFQAAVIGANPPSQAATLTNAGAGTLGWTVADDAGWLTVGPLSGSLGPQESAALSLSTDHSGLEAGTYTATVTVTAAGASNSPQTFFVTLVVDPLPAVDQPDSGYCGLLGLEGLIPLAWLALRRRRRSA